MHKNTTQCPWPGLQIRTLAAELSTLTMRTLHLPKVINDIYYLALINSPSGSAFELGATVKFVGAVKAEIDTKSKLNNDLIPTILSYPNVLILMPLV